ncbi:hypothetical protein LRC484719_27770 [Mycobacterium riyadhense]
MPNIRTDTSELGQTSGRWMSDTPTASTTLPAPIAAPADPISTAILAAVADWPVVHETFTSMRASNATEFTGDNSATITIFSETEAGNTVLINDSVEV